MAGLHVCVFGEWRVEWSADVAEGEVLDGVLGVENGEDGKEGSC